MDKPTQDLIHKLCVSDITWDGTDDFGSKIGKGVYVYKLKVRSPSTGLASRKNRKTCNPLIIHYIC